jgi:predicted nuclease of predicted toxin-antitoxin system
MGVGATVVRELRAEGHDAIHLEELGLRTLPDAVFFRLAQEQRRIVLTFDLDFAAIAAAISTSFPSVVIFRLRFGRPARVMERLRVVLSAAGEALERGAVVVVDESRIRIRSLPLVDQSN